MIPRGVPSLMLWILAAAIGISVMAVMVHMAVDARHQGDG
jgi:hypothetical protein